MGVRSVALSPGTEERLARVFAGGELDAARRLLLEACGSNLPLLETAPPESIERIRLAALRVGGHSLDALREAVALAQLDWRDLLMAADFGDPDAHRSWWPERSR